MTPEELVKGESYHLCLKNGDCKIKVSFNHETINTYVFISETNTSYYLHYHQVIMFIEK